MRGKDPKTVGFSPKRLHPQSLGDVPHPYGAILRVGDDEFVFRVEQHAGHVVGVPAHGVYFPGLGLVHAPEFDWRRGGDKGQRGGGGSYERVCCKRMTACIVKGCVARGRTRGFVI